MPLLEEPSSLIFSFSLLFFLFVLIGVDTSSILSSFFSLSSSITKSESLSESVIIFLFTNFFFGFFVSETPLFLLLLFCSLFLTNFSGSFSFLDFGGNVLFIGAKSFSNFLYSSELLTISLWDLFSADF